MGILDEARARITDTRNVGVRTPDFFDASGLADAKPRTLPKKKKKKMPFGGFGGGKQKKPVTDKQKREAIDKMHKAGANMAQIHNKMKEVLGAEWTGDADKEAVVGESDSFYYLKHGVLRSEADEGKKDPNWYSSQSDPEDPFYQGGYGFDLKTGEAPISGNGKGWYTGNPFERSLAHEQQAKADAQSLIQNQQVQTDEIDTKLDTTINEIFQKEDEEDVHTGASSVLNTPVSSTSAGPFSYLQPATNNFEDNFVDNSFSNQFTGGWDNSPSIEDSWSPSSGGSGNYGGGHHWYDGGVVHANSGLNPNEHPGMAKGTDQVPAWLTEDEFVVDADSAKRFRPQLEAMNKWKPTGGFEGAMSDLDRAINDIAFNRR